MEKKELNLEERRAILEDIVNGKALKRDMIRKEKQYPKDYVGYHRTAEVTDALKVGSVKDGRYLVPDEMEDKLVQAIENKGVVRKLVTIIKTDRPLKIPRVSKKPIAHWGEEGGEMKDSNMEFYQVIIDAHKNGLLTAVTEELLEDSGDRGNRPVKRLDEIYSDRVWLDLE